MPIFGHHFAHMIITLATHCYIINTYILQEEGVEPDEKAPEEPNYPEHSIQPLPIEELKPEKPPAKFGWIIGVFVRFLIFLLILFQTT